MDHSAGAKSHMPCQSWAGQNDWSSASTSQLQRPPFNPLLSSQHLSLGSSSGQGPSYDLQAHPQSCMMDSSGTLSALYKPFQSNCIPSSNGLFANSAFPNSSRSISFVQQTTHTSPMLLSGNQRNNIPPPSLPHTNQAPRPCNPQQPPLSSTHNLYKGLVQPQLNNQGFPNSLRDLPVSLPSCKQQHASTYQATSEGVNVEFAGVFGNTRSHSSSTQEPPQWIPCRGAPNESVPDAALHHSKESSQDGNVTPQASNATRRSMILQQRAQLLQQLAELDKCLETAPPDDSSDGQSAHTEFPPPVDDPSQCEESETSDSEQVQPSDLKSEPSPENYEQNETCDSPEDPMSEAESVKKESVSVKSEEDSDPDFNPNRDSESSSDEASDSKPLTPTDKRPSVPGEKRAQSETPLLQDENVNPPKRIRPANLKKSSETPVLPCSSTKKKRIYDRRNYCLFCSKPVSKMSRHLERIHSDKPEVAAAFQFPKKSKERLKIWHRLINQGNFAHNKDVLKTGKGQLAARKRPKHTKQAGDFAHCLYCQGLFLKKRMFVHIKSCPEKGKREKESHHGRRQIVSRCVLEATDDLGISERLKSLLSSMNYNDVTQTILDDEVILQYGELLFSHYGNYVKKQEYIRQRLREIGRLVLEAQKISPLKKLEDFFLPSSFPYVVSAVNIVAGYNAESKRYSTPSLAMKLGYDLQKACSIVESNAVKSGDERLAESARKFLSVYQKKWNKQIYGGALSSLRETQSNKVIKVPLVQDVKRLILHMESVHHLAEKELRDSSSAQSYAALVKVILVRTVFFNRRRGTEVSSLKLTDYLSRENPSLHAGNDTTMSNLEGKMCRFFTSINVQGSNGRLVPIILKPSFVSAIDLFIKVREACGVPDENSFLFARPKTLTSFHVSTCVLKYAQECGVKEPRILTFPNIQNHHATMVQMINLDEDEADKILGADNQVRNLRQNSSLQLDDTDVDSDGIDDRKTKGSHMTRRKSVNSGKKGGQIKHKQKWGEAEVEAVEKHMMRFIEEHRVPQKDDCVQCLVAERAALRTRSWRGVKDYVRNRITSLKSAKERDAKDSAALTSKKISKQHTAASGPNNQAPTHTMQQDDAVTDSDDTERLQCAKGRQAAHRNERRRAQNGPAQQTHRATTGANRTAPPKPINSGKKGAQNKGKHKWEEAEVVAVERHMMRFIKGHKVPQKQDCIQCLAAEPEALRNRSWKGVKDYIRNRITALRRQSRKS